MSFVIHTEGKKLSPAIVLSLLCFVSLECTVEVREHRNDAGIFLSYKPCTAYSISDNMYLKIANSKINAKCRKKIHTNTLHRVGVERHKVD